MNKINVFLILILMIFVSCASNNAQKEEDNKVITENKTTQNEVKVDVKTDEVKTEKKEEVIENKVDPTAVENVNIKEEVVKNETKTVSDECVYQDYKIKATVVKIEQTENSIKQRTFKNGYKGFEVIFKFKSNEKIEETSAKEIIDNNNYMFLLNNGLYPGSFYIHKYKIEENKEFDALLKVKKSGVCEQNYTVKIEGLNDEDYFESNKSKPEREMKPKKPVIYLYPEKDMKVSVKIESDKLSHTYPKYENGWEVFAKKDGMITNLKTNTEHYCLFWEGINTNAYSIDEGFVVKGDDSIKFLEEKLEILGLNRKEANEFIIYWLPQLEQNQLNLIKFVTEEYNNDYPLVISPKPDSIIRVFMIFKKIDAIDGTIKEQKLIPAKRKGFSVVEWGGSEIE